MRSIALLVAATLAAPLPSAAAPDLTPRFALTSDRVSVAIADDAPQDPSERGRTGRTLVVLGVTAGLLGVYAYANANGRPGARDDDPRYVGLATAVAYGLWAAGAAAVGWGVWLLRPVGRAGGAD